MFVCREPCLRVIAAAGLVAAGALLYRKYLSSSFLSEEEKELQRRSPPVVPFSFARQIQFFSCPFLCLANIREEFGFKDCFTMSLLGAKYTFVFQRSDVERLLNKSESTHSLRKAFVSLFFAFVPNLPRNTPDHFQPLKHNSTTKVIVQAMPNSSRRVWVGEIREMLKEVYFNEMSQTEGEFELWDWSRDTYVCMYVTALLGPEAGRDRELLATWVKLFHVSDPLLTMTSFWSFLSFATSYTVLGERWIFTTIRRFVDPFLEKLMLETVKTQQAPQEKTVLAGMVAYWWKASDGDERMFWAAKRRIANDAFNFTFSAIDNSFSAFAWTLFHILDDTNGTGKHVRAEIDAFIQANDISLDSLNKMSNLQGCVREVARLYTPSMLGRLSSETFETESGFVVPKGHYVSVCPYHNMRDPNLFKDPLRFDPQRDPAELKAAGNMYHPFGNGAHPCPGQGFAMINVGLLVVAMFENLDMEVAKPIGKDRWGSGLPVLEGCKEHPPIDFARQVALLTPSKPVILRYRGKNKSSTPDGLESTCFSSEVKRRIH